MAPRRNRWVLVSAASLVAALALSGCASDGVPEPQPAPPPQARFPSGEVAPPRTVVIDDKAPEDTRPKTEVFAGSDTLLNTAPRRGQGGGGGDVSLDFADADIKDVVRTVLGDVLKVPYLIDPQVQGKVTLKTSRPLRREDVIAALETALKANGAVIVRADNVYNVVPAADAAKRVDGFERHSGDTR